MAQVQTILPWFAEDAPFVAALHPVNALLLFWGGLTIARRATTMARERVEETAEASQPQPTAT
jgi:hypothetical protein